VEEPPHEDGGGDDEQAEGLIAAEEAALFGAALVFGQLLLVRLDAAFDHALCSLRRMRRAHRFTTHQYRGLLRCEFYEDAEWVFSNVQYRHAP
jgi:hypothetical protein